MSRGRAARRARRTCGWPYRSLKTRRAARALRFGFDVRQVDSGLEDPDRPRSIRPMVRLLPMENAVWEAWRVASIAAYAADMVRVGSWPQESAEERAAALFASVVPDGRDTAGHEFRSIVTDSGDAVGALWFAAEVDVGHGTAFIWDIAIDPAHRGRGYGRAAMDELEPLARSLGYDTIRLHVFGDNAVARGLYQRVGYTETDVTMVKLIG